MKTELEEDIMPIKVQVRVGAEAMIDFMLYHIYASAVGVITIILGILNIGLGIAFASRKEFLYMAGAFAFAVIFCYCLHSIFGEDICNERLFILHALHLTFYPILDRLWIDYQNYNSKCKCTRHIQKFFSARKRDS